MQTRKERLRYTTLPKIPDRYKELLDKPIDGTQFRDMFKLLLFSVDHEVGNGMGAVHSTIRRIIAKKKGISIGNSNIEKDELYLHYWRAHNAQHCLFVMATFGCATTGANIKAQMLDKEFSPELLEKMGYIEGKEFEPNIQQMRVFILEKLMVMQREMGYLQGVVRKTGITDSCCWKAMRTFEYGQPLFKALKIIALGNLDFMGAAPCVEAEGFVSGHIGNYSVKVMVNQLFMWLIYANIVENAERAAKKIGANQRVETNIFNEGGMRIYEFTDQGGGMPPEIMNALNRGEKGVTTKVAGEQGGEEMHGIGFWYCRQLAEKMGGKLFVKESIVGKGTTVRLEVRLAPE